MIAKRALDALRAPAGIDGITIELNAHVGLALSQQQTQNAGALLRSAQRGAAQARLQPRGNGYALEAHSSRRSSPPTTLDLNGDLRRALANRELEVHYQPEIDLRTGEIWCLIARQGKSLNGERVTRQPRKCWSA